MATDEHDPTLQEGNPEQLKNWRPLSLINTDAKIFTKWLANRLRPLIGKLIHPMQKGFIPGRQISEQGWILQSTIDLIQAGNCKQNKEDHAVAASLDQEKAYDRVHPDYLIRVLRALNFPWQWSKAILKMFFGTRITLNML